MAAVVVPLVVAEVAVVVPLTVAEVAVVVPLAAAEVVPAAALLVGRQTVQVIELATGQVTDPVVDLKLREQH